MLLITADHCSSLLIHSPLKVKKLISGSLSLFMTRRVPSEAPWVAVVHDIGKNILWMKRNGVVFQTEEARNNALTSVASGEMAKAVILKHRYGVCIVPTPMSVPTNRNRRHCQCSC